MHQQEVGRIFLLAHNLRNACSHRNGRNARRTDQRVELTAGELVHELGQQHAAGRAAAERDDAQHDDLDGLKAQEGLAIGGSADRYAKDAAEAVRYAEAILGRA